MVGKDISYLKLLLLGKRSLMVSQRAKERPETVMPELEARMWPERRFRAIINQK